jgi:hypothetical protein
MVVVEATPAVEATPGGSGSVTSCSVQLGSCPMHPEFADLTYNDTYENAASDQNRSTYILYLKLDMLSCDSGAMAHAVR